MWRYSLCEDIHLLRLTSKIVDLRKEYANSFLLRKNVVLITHTGKKQKRTTRALFSFLVEVWRFELQASSSRSRKNMFFEHHCLHIVRIFREIASFCTFVPFIPYRTFLVVVSYVVKLKIRLKAENGEPNKAFSPPLTSCTRVKKYARNIRLVCCIVTLKQKEIKSF